VRYPGRGEHRGQVPDRGHVELAQAGEDVPGEDRRREIDDGGRAGAGRGREIGCVR